MLRRLAISAGAVLLCVSVALAQGKKSDSVVKADAKADKPAADGKQTVTVTLVIDKGWHLYANPVNEPPPPDFPGKPTLVKVEAKVKPKDTKVEYPKGKEVQDKIIGNYRVYEGTTVIKAVVERAQGETGPLTLNIDVQACNDKTCLLPATIRVTVP